MKILLKKKPSAVFFFLITNPQLFLELLPMKTLAGGSPDLLPQKHKVNIYMYSTTTPAPPHLTDAKLWACELGSCSGRLPLEMLNFAQVMQK